jgi:uncharacterized protein YjbJ (UPF0337 family)
MNWATMEARWTSEQWAFRERWSRLTDDDLLAIAGKRDQLLVALQQRYGRTKDAVASELAAFELRLTRSYAMSR